MNFSNHFVFQSRRIYRIASEFWTVSITAACRFVALGIRAAAFALVLGALFSAQAFGIPFFGIPIAVPGTFEAENFDLGGEGVAYHDNVPGNAGGQYRLNEDVDIIVSSDPLGGGYVVNNFETGEWLAYTINVAASAQYDIELRVSSAVSNSAFHIEVDGQNVTRTVSVPNTRHWNTFQLVLETGEWLAYTINVAASAQYDIELRASSAFTNSAFHIEIDGQNVTGTVSVPNTGNWNTFQWVGKTGVPLAAGQHVLKIVADQQYFNLNSIRVTAVPVSTPYSGTPIAVPGTFEAENFDLGGEGVAYHDNTPGNQGGQYRLNEDVDIILSSDTLGGGYVVNNFETGEWLAYTINVVASAQNDIPLRASSQFGNSTFHLEIDGRDVAGTVSVPHTRD